MQLTQTPGIAQHRLVQTLGYQKGCWCELSVAVTTCARSSTHSKGMCYLYTTTSQVAVLTQQLRHVVQQASALTLGARRSADADHLHSATQRTGPVRLGASR